MYEDLKDETADDSDIIKYSFFGINLRYKYNDDYITKVTHLPEDSDDRAYTQIITPTFLALGEGSDAEKRDMQLIESILDSSKTVDELLALNPDDYEFEVVDKNMFFRLMTTALTGEAHKESSNLSYWEKPSYAFMSEKMYIDNYKFQIAFLQGAGCVDELYIDVLFKNGEGYKDYVQLSDMIDNNTATEEQKQAFETITKIVNDIKENENYIVNADEYKDKTIADIDFYRLYDILNDIHENNFEPYYENPHVEIIECQQYEAQIIFRICDPVAPSPWLQQKSMGKLTASPSHLFGSHVHLLNDFFLFFF